MPRGRRCAQKTFNDDGRVRCWSTRVAAYGACAMSPFPRSLRVTIAKCPLCPPIDRLNVMRPPSPIAITYLAIPVL